MSSKIEAVPLVKSPNQLMDSLAEIKLIKKALRNICRIIVRHEKVSHEDGRSFFSLEEWKTLYQKVEGEKFKEERGAIERGRSFATAYTTPMGKEVDEFMLHKVQNGYEAISQNEIDVEGVFDMNIYRVASQTFTDKIKTYKKNIERVRKIIYKEN